MKVQCIVQFLRILIGFKGKSIISIQQWIEMNMKDDEEVCDDV